MCTEKMHVVEKIMFISSKCLKCRRLHWILTIHIFSRRGTLNSSSRFLNSDQNSLTNGFIKVTLSI